VTCLYKVHTKNNRSNKKWKNDNNKKEGGFMPIDARLRKLVSYYQFEAKKGT